MADVRGSGGIITSQAEQGMKLFKAAEVETSWGHFSKDSMVTHFDLLEVIEVATNHVRTP